MIGNPENFKVVKDNRVYDTIDKTQKEGKHMIQTHNKFDFNALAEKSEDNNNKVLSNQENSKEKKN